MDPKKQKSPPFPGGYSAQEGIRILVAVLSFRGGIVVAHGFPLKELRFGPIWSCSVRSNPAAFGDWAVIGKLARVEAAGQGPLG